MHSIPDTIDGRPAICGFEREIAEGISAARSSRRRLSLERLRSGFAVALHMHQPLIPAGAGDPKSAVIISNLEHLFRSAKSEDQYNAGVFLWCYRRMGEFIPELVNEGFEPRIMLDYSGCLLHGLRQMGRGDVVEALRRITCDPTFRDRVEWLGTAWGHPVVPSTPPQDFRLHVQAWRHHFAVLFGPDALARVEGFSPPEMAIPNHPDVFFEFVRTLRESGYRWVLVQEHTVERPEDGGCVRFPHVPHRLIARNSRGREIAIIAIVKTQGSDTKLVAQLQPYYEAKALSPITLAGRTVPPLVVQISDGENGGVMMNEFPPKYRAVMREASGSATPPLNVSEYLDALDALGVGQNDLPVLQPHGQSRLWNLFEPGSGPESMAAVIAGLKQHTPGFTMEGGSWTGNRSWVRGYEDVLGPMEQASALFAEKALNAGIAPSDPRYREALFHLLLSQTSCFRYWGQGTWTEYGRELCRRTIEILDRNF